jgi:hypothetical protein
MDRKENSRTELQIIKCGIMRYTTLFYVKLLDDLKRHYIHLFKNNLNETSNSVEKSFSRSSILAQTLRNSPPFM